MLRISGAGCCFSEDKGAATCSGISASQKEVALPRREAPIRRNALLNSSANDETRFTSTNWNLFVWFYFWPTCPPEILSAAAAPGALTDSETKTPQPRCSARPRPLLLKGQYSGMREGGVRLSHMAASLRHHVRSIRLPPRIHTCPEESPIQTRMAILPLNPFKKSFEASLFL